MEYDFTELKQRDLDLLSDEELTELIRFYHRTAKTTGTWTTIVDILISDRAARQSIKIAKQSRIISIVSICIALFALLFSGVAGIFSYIDYKGDIEWQDKQLNKLNEIKIELEKSNKINKSVQKKIVPISRNKNKR